MLIDRYSANHRFAERHSLEVPRPMGAVYAGIKSVRFTDMPMVSRLLALGTIGSGHESAGFADASFAANLAAAEEEWEQFAPIPRPATAVHFSS